MSDFTARRVRWHVELGAGTLCIGSFGGLFVPVGEVCVAIRIARRFSRSPGRRQVSKKRPHVLYRFHRQPAVVRTSSFG